MNEDQATKQQLIVLPRFKTHLTLVIDPDGTTYLVMKELCALLGLSSVQQQVARIKEHQSYAKYLMLRSVNLGGYKRTVQCFGVRPIWLWIGSINPTLVSPDIRNSLVDLQEELMDAINTYVTGAKAVDPMDALVRQFKGDIASLRLYVEHHFARLEHFRLHLEARLTRLEDE